ncbi:hypothetical protein, partial [Vibrio parahaemolyticus]
SDSNNNDVSDDVLGHMLYKSTLTKYLMNDEQVGNMNKYSVVRTEGELEKAIDENTKNTFVANKELAKKYKNR